MRMNSPLCRSCPVGSILALVLFGALGASNLMAETLAFASSGDLFTNVGAQDPVNLGLVFTPKANVEVLALGIYDQPYLKSSQRVGLYNASGDLLASTRVTLSDPVVNDYLFQTITPVILIAGEQYTVDTFVGRNAWAYGTTAPIHSADIAYDYEDYRYASGLRFPSDTSGAAGGPSGTYYGPNVELENATAGPNAVVAPECSTSLLLGAGLVLLSLASKFWLSGKREEPNRARRSPQISAASLAAGRAGLDA